MSELIDDNRDFSDVAAMPSALHMDDMSDERLREFGLASLEASSRKGLLERLLGVSI